MASTVGDKLTEQTFEVSEHAILGHAAGDGDFVARNSRTSDDMRYSRDATAKNERPREKIAWVIEPGEMANGRTSRDATLTPQSSIQTWATSVIATTSHKFPARRRFDDI